MAQIPRDSFRPALIKPTYNVGDYGHDVIIPLNCITGSNTTTLTPSTATFVQVLEDGRVPVDEANQFITDSDKMELVHAGNDTDFDTTWEWLPDMSFQAYKASFCVAVAMKVSAFTSGTFAISSVQLTLKSVGGGEGDEVIVDKIINPVILQTIKVSIIGPSIATSPSLTGSLVIAVPCAMDSVPMPASLENAARLMPVIMTTPKAPPAMESPENAS